MVTSVGEQQSAHIDFATDPLFTMPSGHTPEAITTDGHGLVFLELADGRLRFFWDGEGGEPLDGLHANRDGTAAVLSSDDGLHFAYCGERSGRAFMGRDGREEPPFDVISGSVPPVFSPGGTQLAYGAEVAGEYRLVVDGEVASELPIAPIQAVFGPSAERLAFVETRTAADDKAELRIVLDGAPGPWFRAMRNARGGMRFSPDGRRFAFFRIDEQGRSQWIVDGRAQRQTNEVRSIGLAQLRGIAVIEAPVMASFSPDSRRFAYCADVVEKGVAVLEDDVAGPLFKWVGTPVFSPDSRHLAYIAGASSKKSCLVLDGIAGPEWTAPSSSTPVFSPDSWHVAVTFLREEGGFLRKRHVCACAVDGRIIAEVEGDAVSPEPVFSPDGERLAWWTRHDDIDRMMVNEAAHTEDHIAYSEPVFTRSGHLVYAVITVPEGKVTVLVDGRPGPLADVLIVPRSTIAVYVEAPAGDPTLTFAVSPDGEHVAWAGVFGEESRPVIDDRVGPPFDRILNWTFDASGAALWWAQRADTVYRVSAHTDET